MNASISLLGWAGFLLLAGCLTATLFGERIKVPIFSSLLAIAALLSGGAALLSGRTIDFALPEPFYFGLAPIAFRLDALASFFLLLLATVALAVAMFSPGYLSHSGHHIKPQHYWTSLLLFVLSMGAVMLAANALTFLVFWEIMSLSSAVLVGLDFTSTKSQRAALIYLGATRVATALLAGGFIWLHSLLGGWSFADWHLSGGIVQAPAVLLLLGLAIKAGLWPFHIWLPYAHPAAPSPVSALMSGVMIKIALYAMIRFFAMDPTGSVTLACVLGFLGMVSAVWGVVFALVQQDLKRLLAYSSVENVGIIGLGIAACLYGRASGLDAVAAIGLVAALFHCFNHGLFKSLLFLGAGAVDSAAHSRDLSQLGGLARTMPWTCLGFVIGSASICAIPPFNGFASKWLVYQALFQMASHSHDKVLVGLAVACIGALALVGGLALACFTKAVGVAFLGRPRSKSAQNARECTPLMTAAQGLLASACAALGLASPWVSGLLEQMVGSGHPGAVPILPLHVLAACLLLTAVLLYLLVLGGRKGCRRYLTWECGYGPLSPHMQVTGESFAQPVAVLFQPVLQYSMHSEITGRDRRHFPENVKAEAEISSLLESRVYGPAISAVRWASSHLARLQAGSIHLYLLYVLITLIALLLLGSNV